MPRTKNANHPPLVNNVKSEEVEDEGEEDALEQSEGVDEEQSEGVDEDHVDLSTVSPGDYAMYTSYNQYERPVSSTDHHFRTLFQQHVHDFAYSELRNFEEHQPIRWGNMNTMKQYEGLHRLLDQVGLSKIVTFNQSFNPALIRQFYATLYVAPDRSSITWMTEHNQYSVTKARIEWILGFPPGDDFERVHEEAPLPLEAQATLYRLGKVNGLCTSPGVVNRLIRQTILPRAGNSDEIWPLAWNIIDHIFREVRFDVVHCILEEMARSVGDLEKAIYFAPYIMRIILVETDFDGDLLKSSTVYTPRELHGLFHFDQEEHPQENKQQQASGQ